MSVRRQTPNAVTAPLLTSLSGLCCWAILLSEGDDQSSAFGWSPGPVHFLSERLLPLPLHFGFNCELDLDVSACRSNLVVLFSTAFPCSVSVWSSCCRVWILLSDGNAICVVPGQLVEKSLLRHVSGVSTCNAVVSDNQILCASDVGLVKRSSPTWPPARGSRPAGPPCQKSWKKKKKQCKLTTASLHPHVPCFCQHVMSTTQMQGKFWSLFAYRQEHKMHFCVWEAKMWKFSDRCVCTLINPKEANWCIFVCNVCLLKCFISKGHV